MAVLGTLGCQEPPPDPEVGFDVEQKARALRLISVFENGTPELQYAYVEDLDDGRGLTVGLGFTTATGDALDVVERYQAEIGDNGLTPYLFELQILAAAESDDTGNLAGFSDAWVAAADDDVFRSVQETVTDVDSYEPALAHAEELGLISALPLMVLFDSVWMHGDGDDDDGVPHLIDVTCVDPADEDAWMRAFLEVRRSDLLNPADPATQAEWSKAVTRVDALLDLVDAGNLQLRGPIEVGRGYDVVVD